ISNHTGFLQVILHIVVESRAREVVRKLSVSSFNLVADTTAIDQRLLKGIRGRYRLLSPFELSLRCTGVGVENSHDTEAGFGFIGLSSLRRIGKRSPHDRPTTIGAAWLVELRVSIFANFQIVATP